MYKKNINKFNIYYSVYVKQITYLLRLLGININTVPVLDIKRIKSHKIVDDRSVSNLDPQRNKIETRHVNGTNYTDVVVTCLLDYGEPNGQDATDTASASDSLYVFDELGLVSYASSGTGKLLTHVIFHPVQKSLNRLIQIDYTVRVQSLTGFNEG